MEADTMRTHDLIREKLEDEICAEINNLRSKIAKAEENLRSFSDSNILITLIVAIVEYCH